MDFLNSCDAFPLDTLSRLKGMETRVKRTIFFVVIMTLDTLSRLKGMETFSSVPHRFSISSCLLWIHFPVGRELKRILELQSEYLVRKSERTFPLEGNGNTMSNRASPFHQLSCPKGLSRWKGMETQHPSLPPARSTSASERTFPLEGNGNVIRAPTFHA